MPPGARYDGSCGAPSPEHPHRAGTRCWSGGVGRRCTTNCATRWGASTARWAGLPGAF